MTSPECSLVATLRLLKYNPVTATVKHTNLVASLNAPTCVTMPEAHCYVVHQQSNNAWSLVNFCTFSLNGCTQLHIASRCVACKLYRSALTVCTGQTTKCSTFTVLHFHHRPHLPHSTKSACSIYLALLSFRSSSSSSPSPPAGLTALGWLLKVWKSVQRNSNRGIATHVSHTILKEKGYKWPMPAVSSGIYSIETSWFRTIQATR